MLNQNARTFAFLFFLTTACGPGFSFQTNEDPKGQHPNLMHEPQTLGQWNDQMLAGISAKYEAINAIAAVFRTYHEVKQTGAFEILPAWQKDHGFEPGKENINSSIMDSFSSDDTRTDDEMVSFDLLEEEKPPEIDREERFANYGQYLTGLSNVMRSQGDNVRARGQFLMDLATHNKSFSEIEGLRIKNIGEGIKNVGLQLDNVEKAVDIQLKQHYAVAYSSYVRTFQDYADFMSSTYAKMDRTASATIGTITINLRKYNRQMAICSQRAKNIWSMRLVEANEEMSSSKLSYRNIREQFEGYTIRPYGEQCLDRVLLTSHGEKDALFNNLSFNPLPTSRGNVFGIKCPLRAAGIPEEALGDVPFSRYFDLMEYPEYIRAKEAEKDAKGNFTVYKNQVLGVYRPATLYQFYRLMTNKTYRVELNSPLKPEHDRDQCEFVKDGELFDSEHPDRKAYFDVSRSFEEEMAEQVKIEEQNILGSFATYPSIDLKEAQTNRVNGNQTYESLLKMLDIVFAKVEGCIQAQERHFGGLHIPPAAEGGAGEDANAPVGVGANVPEVGSEIKLLKVSDLGPLIAGEPSRSYLSAFDDPKLPKASESIRMCVGLAEEHRFQAFQKLQLITAVQEVLTRFSETKPPRSPHPVQFEPAQGNMQSAGNDFR